jgi:predicted esterase
MTRSLSFLLPFLLLACGSSTPTGGNSDAGLGGSGGHAPLPDAGEPADSGPLPDAGDPADASPPDASTPSDAGNPTDAGLSSSKGTGGLVCSQTGDLGGGRTYCVSKIQGVEVRLADVAPTENGPVSLAIYVHGDGAAAYKSNGAMKALLPWADLRHVRVLAVLAPNGCAWWQKPTHDCASAVEEPDTLGENTVAFEAVLEEIRARYDINFDPTFYYGSSGGTIFLAGAFLPRYGNIYPGAFAMNCGGTPQKKSDFTWNPDDAAARGSTKLWFTYGDQDFLKVDEHGSAVFYSDLGFPVDEKIIPGADHCAFDSHGRAKEVWSEFLGE